MAKSLGPLLSDSFSYYKSHIVAILAVAIVVGIITALAPAATMGGAAGEMKKFQQNNMYQDMMNINEEALQQAMMAGDEEAVEEMMKGVEQGTQMQLDLLKKMLPYFGIWVLLSAIIQLIAYSLFTLIAIRGCTGVKCVTTHLSDVFPLIGLWVWIFIRTFAWIPLVGIVTSIVLGPRFVLAPILLLEQRKGVMASASESYKLTSGQWGKIFGNLFVGGLCVWLAAFISSMIIRFLPFSHVLWGIVMALCSAYIVIFAVQLGRSLLADKPAGTVG